ncbi:MAG: hypothetical protein CVV44_00770 [Spirochaetae bacterium HGW-Spirochaetae-1]|jgi:anti-anti-sigma factor|nr:MAG: hypothetical protein CVV44_00770 [Spirochaetae bacterium HGW-Spirochaetae-1]
MKLHSQYTEDYFLLKVEGSLSVETLNTFEHELLNAHNKGLHIIIDFSSLVFIDSSSLGVIVVFFTKQISVKKHLVLLNVGKDIMEMFEITGLSKRVHIFSSLDRALDYIHKN